MDDLQKPTVGALLKSRRQERGLSLAEIAEKTHIRRAYLEAMEANLFETLPGGAYQSGFLRNYAGALGLDPGSVLRQWREQTGRAGETKKGEYAAASPVLTGASPPVRPRRRPALLLLPLLLVATGAFYFSAGNRHGAEAQVPAPPVPALPVPALPVPALPVPALPQPAELIVSSPPLDKSLPPLTSVAGTEGATVAGAAENRALPAQPVIPAEGSVIRLEATAPLVAEVTVDNRPLRRYVLSTASALQWNVGRFARLAVDNPAAVKLWLGGEPLDLAGRSEIVLQAAIPE